MLKTALPTTPLTPMSSLVTKSPMVLVASSGALDPAAMKVAPATSGDSPRAEMLQKYYGSGGLSTGLPYVLLNKKYTVKSKKHFSQQIEEKYFATFLTFADL